MNQRIEEPHKHVAGEVRAILARRRISGRGAARELGWDPNYIARRLDGRTPFDANDLVALAGLLDVPVAAFFTHLETVAPKPRKIVFPEPVNSDYQWPHAA